MHQHLVAIMATGSLFTVGLVAASVPAGAAVPSPTVLGGPGHALMYSSGMEVGPSGVLGAAKALVWGRPPAGDHEVHPSVAQALALRAAHREAVLRAVAEYNEDLVVVLDVDFGHTGPQFVLPYGGRMTVDGTSRRVVAHFPTP